MWGLREKMGSPRKNCSQKVSTLNNNSAGGRLVSSQGLRASHAARPDFGAELSKETRVESIGATSSNVHPQFRSALDWGFAFFDKKKSKKYEK